MALISRLALCTLLRFSGHAPSCQNGSCSLAKLTGGVVFFFFFFFLFNYFKYQLHNPSRSPNPSKVCSLPTFLACGSRESWRAGTAPADVVAGRSRGAGAAAGAALPEGPRQAGCGDTGGCQAHNWTSS